VGGSLASKPRENHKVKLLVPPVLDEFLLHLMNPANVLNIFMDRLPFESLYRFSQSWRFLLKQALKHALDAVASLGQESELRILIIQRLAFKLRLKAFEISLSK